MNDSSDFDERCQRHKDFPIDWGGHFQTDGAPRDRDGFAPLYLVLMLDHLGIGYNNLDERLERIQRTGKAEEVRLYGNCSPCGDCGQKLVGKLTLGGLVIRGPVGDGRCPFPGGLPPYSFEIDVPSGKLVVANDLRSFFPDVERGHISLRGNTGCRDLSVLYAAEGLGFGYVGNTSPDVYQVSPEKLLLGQAGFVEPNDEGNPPVDTDPALLRRWEEHPDEIGEVHLEGKRVARVCTDLWWYCLADLDLLTSRGFVREDEDVVDVRPGRWRITHQYQLAGISRDFTGRGDLIDPTKPSLFATAEWTR